MDPGDGLSRSGEEARLEPGLLPRIAVGGFQRTLRTMERVTMDLGTGDSFQTARLQRMLREELPLAAFMDVRVRRRDESGLVLWAPEEPNRNLHGSLFGGSLGALALLAGWGFVHLWLREEREEADVVVQRAETEYLTPMAGPVLAVALPPDPPAWHRFLRTFRRRGRARIRVTIQLHEEGHAGPDAVMEAWFVALAPGA